MCELVLEYDSPKDYLSCTNWLGDRWLKSHGWKYPPFHNIGQGNVCLHCRPTIHFQVIHARSSQRLSNIVPTTIVESPYCSKLSKEITFGGSNAITDLVWLIASVAPIPFLNGSTNCQVWANLMCNLGKLPSLKLN